MFLDRPWTQPLLSTTPLLSSPLLNPWSGDSKLNQCGGFHWGHITSRHSTYSVNSCALFNTGTEAQDRGEDRKKETLSVREWEEKAERTLCSTLLPSNTHSLPVSILAVDALLCALDFRNDTKPCETTVQDQMETGLVRNIQWPLQICK